MNSYVFGVDIGGTAIKLGLFSCDGTLLEKWELPTNTRSHGEHILPDVARSMEAKLSEKGIEAHEVSGIGMGVPGPVAADGTVNECVNLGWGVFNIKEQMNALLPGIPNICAGNDANVAALGELWQGGGKGFHSAVMVTLGTGVGGGVVMNGSIVPGANGAAGEIGHITVEPRETESCNCGKCGCLEQYASATGIVRLANRMLARCDTPSQLRSMEHFSAKDICDLAREGEEMSVSILDRCGYYLGLAMSYVSCTVDPQIFIVGGGMSRAGQVVIRAIRRYYQQFAFSPSAHCPIVLAQLGNDAGIYGGAKLVLG